MIPLLNGILTVGDVFRVKLSKKNWFIRKWRRRHLKRWSEVQKTTFRFQGFSFQNAWGVHSLLLLTQRGGCFWSNFSNWSSLFSPGSISVSDQIHQAAFPSKMAVIKLLNSMEISMTLIRNSMEISTTLAYDTADGMASSSDQQIIIFSTDPPQLQCDFIFFFEKKAIQCDFLGDAFFSRISGASKSHGFRCSSTKTSKP